MWACVTFPYDSWQEIGPDCTLLALCVPMVTVLLGAGCEVAGVVTLLLLMCGGTIVVASKSMGYLLFNGHTHFLSEN